MSTTTPVITAMTKRTANMLSALSGTIASMTNASSPDDAIIMATSAPKLNILCVYSDTVANPPMHPGTEPSRAAVTT